jgi:hypothetical protein
VTKRCPHRGCHLAGIKSCECFGAKVVVPVSQKNRNSSKIGWLREVRLSAVVFAWLMLDLGSCGALAV